MDQTKHQLFMNVQFLRRVITKLVLLSLSLLFFSHHSYQLHFFFSSFTKKLITHTLDKNYTFLLCNFLVLLAKYSKFVTSTSSKHDNNNNNNNYEYYSYKTLQVEHEEEEHEAVQHHQMQLEKDEQEEHDDDVVENHEDGQIEQVITIEEECEFEDGNHGHEVEEVEEEGFNEEEVGWRFWEEIEEKEEEDEERGGGGNGRLSTEELNKKFDDFIRKMKEELRIEAQRHLVIV